MKNGLIFLLGFGFIFSSNSVIAQHGVGVEWSPEINLPKPPGSSSVRGFLYSNIATFSNGKRVVFLNRQDGPGGIYSTYSYDGINWTTPILFAPSSLVIGLNSPKIASDQNDDLHIIWSSQAPKVLYYSQMDSALNVVLDSVRIADNPEFNTYSAMYLTNDLKDRIHVMWNEGKTGVDTPESYYSQSLDGGNTWSTKDTLSNDDSFPSSFPRGQFNAYSGDTLAIFWRDSSSIGVDNWDIQMVVSEDGGLNWTSPQLINPSPSMQGDPDLVIDPLGRFHLFYHEAAVFDPYWGMRIVYGYSDDMGQNWSPSNIFTDTVSLAQRSYLAEGSRFDIVNNRLWTFWKEEDMLGLQGGDMMAAYSDDRGINWSLPEYVTDKSDSTIGFKSVALLPSGGLAVNYELPNFPNTGEFSVLYKERVFSSVGIKELEKESQVSVYPNPALNVITISFGELKLEEIEIFDLSGKLIFSQTAGFNLGNILIDLSDYENGMYIIRLSTAQGIISNRLIKNN